MSSDHETLERAIEDGTPLALCITFPDGRDPIYLPSVTFTPMPEGKP